MQNDASPHILQEIYRIGETMLYALESGDLDRFFTLVDKRGTLLERLKAYTDPSEITAGWQTDARQLAEQQGRLTAAANARERTLSDALAAVERFKEARHQYREEPPTGTILNRNLTV